MGMVLFGYSYSFFVWLLILTSKLIIVFIQRLMNCSNTADQQSEEERLSKTSSSSLKQRFRRKTSTPKQFNRSKSKQSNVSIDSPEFRSLFIKMRPLDSPESKKQDILPERRTRLGRRQNDVKRIPTPCKERKLIQTTAEAEATATFEYEARIDYYRSKIINTEKELRDSKKNNNKFTVEIEVLKQDLANQLSKEKNLQQKIQEMEEIISQSQSNLVETKSNLQKLKTIINQTKTKQLQDENQVLRDTLKKTEAELRSNEMRLSTMQQTVQNLQQSNRQLQRKSNLGNICQMESMREKYLLRELQKLKNSQKAGNNSQELEKHMAVVQLQNYALRKENTNLQIRNDMLILKHWTKEEATLKKYAKSLARFEKISRGQRKSVTRINSYLDLSKNKDRKQINFFELSP